MILSLLTTKNVLLQNTCLSLYLSIEIVWRTLLDKIKYEKWKAAEHYDT